MSSPAVKKARGLGLSLFRLPEGPSGQGGGFLEPEEQNPWSESFAMERISRSIACPGR